MVLSAAFVPEYMRHSVYYSVIGLFFTFCVGVLFVHKPLKIASNKWVNMIAISSYSTYLIHSLVIHAWVKIFNALKITTPFFTVPVMIVSAFVMGYGVYFFIEKKLMYWRDEYLPARKKNASFVNPIYSDYASTVIR